jgi:endonuclease-3 related protein
MDKTLNGILLDIYRELYKRFGPQHWWPADEPFEVIVGAILTQSTAWTNVEKAIANLKTARALYPAALRNIPEEKLAALIRPSGYYNVKARKLKAFAEWFGRQYGDSLQKMFSGDISLLREELLGVYGIGEETADSILLYAGNKPIFVIDAYTRRIIDRVGPGLQKNTFFKSRIKRGRGDSSNWIPAFAGMTGGYGAYQHLFMSNLPADAQLFNEYHALLVRLGKDFCRKKPVCAGCCLNQRKNAVFPCAVEK